MNNAESSMFEMLLASSVHDMKNSLGLLLSEIDRIGDVLQSLPEAQDNGIADAQYQARRINTSLMELLSLYKLEKKQISIHYAEVMVIELLEDVLAAFSRTAEARGVSLELDCDDMLMWFFDIDLISIVLNNIVGNGIRYSKNTIVLRADCFEQQLRVRIEDDGQGYPQHMLGAGLEFQQTVDANSGSTGLGLYFAQEIAAQHQRNGRQGAIHLRNEGELGGGCFELLLP